MKKDGSQEIKFPNMAEKQTDSGAGDHSHHVRWKAQSLGATSLRKGRIMREAESLTDTTPKCASCFGFYLDLPQFLL